MRFWRRRKRAPGAVGLHWPPLDGMDWRYGFPIARPIMAELEAMGEEQRIALLPELEAAAFEALVLCDLDELAFGFER